MESVFEAFGLGLDFEIIKGLNYNSKSEEFEKYFDRVIRLKDGVIVKT